jgi:hypothetical protein
MNDAKKFRNSRPFLKAVLLSAGSAPGRFHLQFDHGIVIELAACAETFSITGSYLLMTEAPSAQATGGSG